MSQLFSRKFVTLVSLKSPVGEKSHHYSPLRSQGCHQRPQPTSPHQARSGPGAPRRPGRGRRPPGWRPELLLHGPALGRRTPSGQDGHQQLYKREKGRQFLVCNKNRSGSETCGEVLSDLGEGGGSRERVHALFFFWVPVHRRTFGYPKGGYPKKNFVSRRTRRTTTRCLLPVA